MTEPFVRETVLSSLEDTTALAARLAPVWAKRGGVVYLEGPLGAGKTTFVRALLAALGHQGTVKSPTYTLVETYRIGPHLVHHFDFYRFADPEEFASGGFEEYFDPPALVLVEWPQKAQPYLPAADWTVRLALETPMSLASESTPLESRSVEAPQTEVSSLDQRSVGVSLDNPLRRAWVIAHHPRAQAAVHEAWE